MITIYGIKNCDTVKKAIKWLDENKVEYHFHDYKKEGISEEKLKAFTNQFGWEKVVNSRGTTFRKLEESQKPTNESEAIALMKEQTSIIKRPILQGDEIFLIGFKADEYEAAFKK